MVLDCRSISAEINRSISASVPTDAVYRGTWGTEGGWRMNKMEGVYVPLVTPFYNGAVDMQSLRRLMEHYIATGIAGLILLGTTGESPTVEAAEQKTLVAAAVDIAAGCLPGYVGIPGDSTRA